MKNRYMTFSEDELYLLISNKKNCSTERSLFFYVIVYKYRSSFIQIEFCVHS